MWGVFQRDGRVPCSPAPASPLAPPFSAPGETKHLPQCQGRSDPSTCKDAWSRASLATHRPTSNVIQESTASLRYIKIYQDIQMKIEMKTNCIRNLKHRKRILKQHEISHLSLRSASILAVCCASGPGWSAKTLMGNSSRLTCNANIPRRKETERNKQLNKKKWHMT